MYKTLLFGEKGTWRPLRSLLKASKPHHQTTIFDAILRNVTKNFLKTKGDMILKIERREAVGGVADLVYGLIADNQTLNDYIEEWLLKSAGDGVLDNIDTRRAVIAALATHEGQISGHNAGCTC